MPDTKITALTAIGANPIIPSTFPIPMVDLTDTSMAASGTTKKVTVNQILGAGGTATLASATITGALTVQSNVNAPANVSLRYGPSGATWAGLRFDATNQTFLDSDIALTFRTGGATSFTTAYTIGATGISTWYVGGSTAMTLNSTGLGVGVTPTVGKVQTNGAFVTTGAVGSLGTNPLGNALIADFSTTTRLIATGANTTTAGVFKFINASSNASVYQEALTIDASSNVGIGVTPSAGKGCLQLSSGINFPATQVASSDANTLDDYEEGTFTPTVIGSTLAGVGTYTQQKGFYTKVGRLVTVNVWLQWTAHTGTGNMSFSGLPFTIQNTSGNYGGISIGYVSNIALTAGNVIYGLTEFGTTNVTVAQSPTGGGTYSLVPMDISAEIAFTATYIV